MMWRFSLVTQTPPSLRSPSCVTTPGWMSASTMAVTESSPARPLAAVRMENRRTGSS